MGTIPSSTAAAAASDAAAAAAPSSLRPRVVVFAPFVPISNVVTIGGVHLAVPSLLCSALSGAIGRGF